MKKNKFLILILLFLMGACDLDYESNPNEPELPPTYALFNRTVKEMMDDSRDEWFSGRFTSPTMQYWSQTEYTEEDRYRYRESTRETWQDFYASLLNLKKVIDFNTDENIKGEMSAYGANENQIAACRIMMAWCFNLMADTWGDIPYYSYGSEDADFQALDLEGAEPVFKPKYAAQEKIYKDILKELKEATEMIILSEDMFSIGDPIYHGDAALWKKFANSLRLRIALKIRGVDASTANTHINEALSAGVFESNDDNAVLVYETGDLNASPMYRSYNVGNRKDFAPTWSFVELIMGKASVFTGLFDPRTPIYVQPNKYGNYVGVPYGIDNDAVVAFKSESLPGSMIIDKPDYGEVLMEYAEVEFIRSELNEWNQTHYENAVKASMSRWGVEEADITSYMGELPAATQENVMTQKYIALYMQPHTSWVEYRRTGFPKTLIMPGDSYTVTVDEGGDEPNKYNYTFTPIVEVTDIPYRMEYPDQERTLNGVNRKEAVDRLSNGDELDSKLWWDVN